MTERDVREGLRDAVAGEPPLHFDPDALVATARRETRRRRALVSASLATVTVAVAAVAVPVMLGISRDQGDLGPGERPASSSAGSSATSPSDTPSRSGTGREYSAAELQRRGEVMRVELEARFLTAVPKAVDVATQPFGGEAAGEVEDGQDYLTTFLTYTLHGKRYGLGINLFARGAYPDDPDQLCVPDPDRCQRLDSDPDRLLAVWQDAGPGNRALRMVTVYHFRTDGSVVSVVGYNYDPTGAPLPSKAVPIPVAVEQLAKLAANPALGL
jgi:hypothetical protein